VIGNRVLTPRQRWREEKPELPPPATETAKNSRIRIALHDAWWRACRVSEYWRIRLDWHNALGTAQQYGIADSASFPSAENESRFGLVDTWREAVVKQLLTPAPDGAAVTWKRAQLAGRGFSHLTARQFIVDGIRFARRQPARDLVHNLNDLPHDITAIATGGGLEQIRHRGADLRLSIVGACDLSKPSENSTLRFFRSWVQTGSHAEHLSLSCRVARAFFTDRGGC
jgi:hypothetical protein